jgi:DnaJ domain
MDEVRPFPLHWPPQVARAKARKSDAFKRRTQAEARDALLDELVRLGARQIVISTDVHLRPDGRNIYANERASDPGAVAYFRRKGKQYVMALDVYNTHAGNLYALAMVIESLRRIERHGSPAMMDAAFRGFAELPAAPEERHWSTVLGVSRDATLAEVEKAYRKLVPLAHPDRGGSVEGASLLNLARDAARRELGG